MWTEDRVNKLFNLGELVDDLCSDKFEIEKECLELLRRRRLDGREDDAE